MAKGGIVIKEVGKEPYFKEVELMDIEGLEEMQKIVGGGGTLHLLGASLVTLQ